ncbi:MAG: alginate O-acetyltransferase AlgF [Alphaproteobacteria bacterium]|nr:alginate O-acetyltransferase AlgF [Alphaproteobacteria bacterium]MCB9791432.1 alginate O-acetyltransferase AlgF [Alphaproteobacteria bacterium]
MRRALALALALVSLPALAGGGLYDPAPPEGSAFVRVFNASGQARSDIDLGGRSLPALQADAASPYVVVQKGSRTAALGAGLSETLEVSAGSFLTIALLPGDKGVEPLVLQDKPNSNLARARVTLYNLSDAPDVDLKLADGSQDVIADVGPRQTGERVVNALTVDLGVFAGETQVKALPGVTLERGGSYSVFVTGAASSLHASWVTDSTKGP